MRGWLIGVAVVVLCAGLSCTSVLKPASEPDLRRSVMLANRDIAAMHHAQALMQADMERCDVVTRDLPEGLRRDCRQACVLGVASRTVMPPMAATLQPELGATLLGPGDGGVDETPRHVSITRGDAGVSLTVADLADGGFRCEPAAP